MSWVISKTEETAPTLCACSLALEQTQSNRPLYTLLPYWQISFLAGLCGLSRLGEV